MRAAPPCVRPRPVAASRVERCAGGYGERSRVPLKERPASGASAPRTGAGPSSHSSLSRSHPRRGSLRRPPKFRDHCRRDSSSLRSARACARARVRAGRNRHPRGTACFSFSLSLPLSARSKGKHPRLLKRRNRAPGFLVARNDCAPHVNRYMVRAGCAYARAR